VIIRKLFKFENAHIVRNCSSMRCAKSIHGHSYLVEVLLEAESLDKGQMVYDFGLLKTTVGTFIDSFDHATAFWNRDDPEYIEAIKKFSDRWISMTVSPSAEQFARFFFVMVQEIIAKTEKMNGEAKISVNSVIVHETATGYAQAFAHDVDGIFTNDVIHHTEYSDQVIKEWGIDIAGMVKKAGIVFKNPQPNKQV
jgi:6-pyruvoyltetrahydropterin/6-carboxytetrahydropterin synthase